MRVQSKRWFRRNRHKSPKLVKVLMYINRRYPEAAHDFEIEFGYHQRYVRAWFGNTRVAAIEVYDGATYQFGTRVS